jgi:hypothetical protein
MKKPKHLFHKKGDKLYVGRDPLPAVEAWIEANRSRFKRGTFGMVEIVHDADCRYPQGETLCTCVDGPEIRLQGDKPETN